MPPRTEDRYPASQQSRELVVDRNVLMIKRKPRKKECWHCGSVDHVVAESPSRGNAVDKRLGETTKVAYARVPLSEKHDIGSAEGSGA